MFKVLAFLTRKPGTSFEQFRNHYENRHLPLARRTFPQIVEHRRNYVGEGAVMFPADGPAPQWDCIAEIWFEDRAGFERMIATVTDPDEGAALREDEARFADSSKSGMIFPDEAVATGFEV